VACFFLEMAEKFNWFRSGYELVTAKFEWKVQVPFLQNPYNPLLQKLYPKDQPLISPLFPTPEIPNSKYYLQVQDMAEKIRILLVHFNSAGKCVNFDEPVQGKISIINKKGTKVFQKMLSSKPDCGSVVFNLYSKEQIIQSDCQQSDGSLTFCCKIFTHVKKESVSSSADPPVLAVDCSGGLSSHFEELFNNMSSSDVSFNIGGREFPAHKLILSARSKYFAAMFKHPMKEKSTNQVNIEDIEPDVFQELLRFIYTGRVRTATMETVAANLFIAADKYLLGELKKECENYLLHHMTPDNCVVLLLHGDLLNPAESLKEAAKFLRRFPNEVMATDEWKKIQQENLVLLCNIHQFVLCNK
jgi:speckle-type POZ protein